MDSIKEEVRNENIFTCTEVLNKMNIRFECPDKR